MVSTHPLSFSKRHGIKSISGFSICFSIFLLLVAIVSPTFVFYVFIHGYLLCTLLSTSIYVVGQFSPAKVAPSYYASKYNCWSLCNGLITFCIHAAARQALTPEILTKLLLSELTFILKPNRNETLTKYSSLTCFCYVAKCLSEISWNALPFW